MPPEALTGTSTLTQPVTNARCRAGILGRGAGDRPPNVCPAPGSAVLVRTRAGVAVSAWLFRRARARGGRFRGHRQIGSRHARSGRFRAGARNHPAAPAPQRLPAAFEVRLVLRVPVPHRSRARCSASGTSRPPTGRCLTGVRSHRTTTHDEPTSDPVRRRVGPRRGAMCFTRPVDRLTPTGVDRSAGRPRAIRYGCAAHAKCWSPPRRRPPGRGRPGTSAPPYGCRARTARPHRRRRCRTHAC